MLFTYLKIPSSYKRDWYFRPSLEIVNINMLISFCQNWNFNIAATQVNFRINFEKTVTISSEFYLIYSKNIFTVRIIFTIQVSYTVFLFRNNAFFDLFAFIILDYYTLRRLLSKVIVDLT